MPDLGRPQVCDLDGRGICTDDLIDWLLASYERDLEDRRRKVPLVWA